jgi:hypothetical protein
MELGAHRPRGSRRVAAVVLVGAIAATGLAIAAKPGGGGGGGGKPKPVIALNPTSLAFGEVVVGTVSAPRSVTVSNTGTANLAFSSVGTTNARFAAANGCPASLAPGANCTIGVTFAPTAVGALAANLVIVTNASNTPNAAVTLSGTGKSSSSTPVVHRGKGGGDSIIRGYNADCTRNTGFFDFLCYGSGDKPQYSFFDGSSASVTSIVDRYVATDPLFSGDQNAAASGSEMTDPAKNNFTAQAAAIVSSATQPTHVFVELGANDICNRPTTSDLYSDATWESAVRGGLDTLVNGLPDGSTVMMVSVPRVQDLRAVGVAKQQSTSNVNCENFWASFDVCRIATANGSDLATRLAAIDARQKAYNSKLASLATEYNAAASTTGVEVVTDYDPTLNASVGSYGFQPGDINGGDCFHPSVQGQNTLSNVLWNKNPHK